MLKPRNTLVVIKLITEKERKSGDIVVPNQMDVYTKAEVIAVGPGNVSADGGRSETFDLAVGQIVHVKHKEKRVQGQMVQMLDTTLQFDVEGVRYDLIEQTAILGIIAEPQQPGYILAGDREPAAMGG